MKSSKLFLTSLLAAAAMSIPAFAETDYSGYAGTIYTFGGWNASTFHNAGFVRCSVSGENSETLTYEEFGGTGNWGNQTSATFPSIQSLFSTANGSTLNTLRFVASGTEITVGGTTKTVSSTQNSQAQFDSLRLGGLIVESGATGWILNTNNNRTFYLGTAETPFKANIGANFTIRAGSSNSVNHTIQLAGSQSWTIASGVTATLGSIVNVNAGANVVVSGGTMAVQRLTGSGILDLGSTGNLSIANTTKFVNWTGTVKIADRTSNIALNNYGTSGSTIELSDFQSYFNEGANGTVAANLVLKNTVGENGFGAKIKNGWNGQAITFSGSVSGDGKLWFTAEDSSSNSIQQTFVFTGDVSGFSGGFTQSGTKANGVLKFGDGNASAAAADASVSGTGEIAWNGKSVVYNYSSDVLASNNITSAVLTKSGAGSLTLTGTNTYTGGTTVEAGTLVAGSVSAFGSGALTVNAGAEVSANGYAVDLGAGNVTINGAYVVTADGSLATSGAITFGAAGTLDVSGLAAGTYTVFGGTGTVSGLTQDKLYKASGRDVVAFAEDSKSFTLTTGSAYNLTWTSAAGTWAADTIWQNNTQGGEENPTFEDGDTVTFAASETAAKEISVVGAKDAQAVNVAGGDYAFSAGEGGSLSVRGALTVSSGASLTLSDGVLGTVAGGIVLDGGTAMLKLVDAGLPGLTNIVSGSGKVVLERVSTQIAEPTISTTNVLTGAISVEKIGNTKVSITAAQSYTGGTTITAGNIGVGHNEALGSGTITLNGSNAQMTSHAADLNFDNAVTIGENGGIVHTQAYTMTLSGAVSGTGTLTKQGTGSLVLSNANLLNGSSSFASKILVSAGTLKLGNNTTNLNIVKAETDGGIEVASGATLQICGASSQSSSSHHKLAKDIVLNNGAFLRYYDASQATGDSYQYELSGTITVNGSATITGDSNSNNYWAKEVALLGNLSGSGTLTYYRGNGDNNFNSNGRLIIAGEDNSGFKGTIVIGGQTTAVSQGLDLKADLANGTVSLQGGSGQAAYMRVLKSATIKGLNGNANSSVGIGNVLQGGEVGAYTLTVGEGNFAGTIEDNGEARKYGSTTSTKVTGAVLSIVKNTAGTLTLSGNNTFSGGVTIEQGVLVARHANALGTTAGTTTVNSGGVLKVAVDGGVRAGRVTLNEGALFAIDLTEYSNVEEDTALTIISSSAISFNSISAGAMSSNDIEAYFSASNSNLGFWSSYLREWSYDTTNGLQLTLTIPEPSMFGLLAGLGALTLAGTRRRRKKA